MQYIVNCRGRMARINFYNYLIKNGYIPNHRHITSNYMNSRFPFVIESDKYFWICESITCCARASQNGQIIDSKFFQEKIFHAISNL